jgi:hypothetical protein
MPDDDQGEILLDWRLVKDAAGGRQDRGGDRQDRADRAPRRRSPPAPKAKMIPFPLNRRRSFVARLAAQVAARPAEAGELHLLQQLDRQRDVLARKGVPEKAIERELHALSAAVRAELWQLIFGAKR